MSNYNSILLDSSDNVVTALINIDTNETFTAVGLNHTLVSKQIIPEGHKAAKEFIPKGSMVIKYGKKIGLALEDIAQGNHVHVHNVKSCRGKGLRGDGNEQI